MTYQQTLDFLYGRRASVYRGLERMRYVLAQLDNPQERFPAVLIAGTNGKGSTAKMLSSILTRAGYRVGCFTSPHLVDFCERITICEQRLAEADVIALTAELCRGPLAQFERDRAALQIEGIISFFELVTAMAFLYFARQQIDLAILEVGIGGRIDPTNTANTIMAVLTNVGLDHQEFLGDTLELIAREKAAIIRTGQDVVVGCRQPEVLAIAAATCRERRAVLHQTAVSPDEADCQARYVTIPERLLATGSLFAYHGVTQHFKHLNLPLAGPHQLENAAVALTTIELLGRKGFPVSETAVRDGLANLSHPGRLEILRIAPAVVVDIAHNAMGAAAIARALTSIFAYEKLIIVLGVLHDKDVRGILSPFLAVADTLIFTSPHNTARAETAAETARIATELAQANGRAPTGYDHWFILEQVADAITQACALAGTHDLICVTGSNYTVSEAEIFFAK